MKKIYLASALLIVILGVYLLPNEKKVTQYAVANCAMDAVLRNIGTPTNWTKWWPGKQVNDSTYTLLAKHIIVRGILVNGFNATVENSKTNTTLNFQYIPITTIKSKFELTSIYHFSSNPFRKMYEYIFYLKEKNEHKYFLAAIENYFNSIEKVYGFDIKEDRVKHAFLLTAKKINSTYPTMEELYALISELKQYIKSKNGIETDFPIFNVVPLNANQFEYMVAIPIKAGIAANNQFIVKRMILGNIVVAEVKGGNANIELCKMELENYLRDHRKISPAMPFQKLITNRLEIKDTTKWVTTWNYPIF